MPSQTVLAVNETPYDGIPNVYQPSVDPGIQWGPFTDQQQQEGVAQTERPADPEAAAPAPEEPAAKQSRAAADEAPPQAPLYAPDNKDRQFALLVVSDDGVKYDASSSVDTDKVFVLGNPIGPVNGTGFTECHVAVVDATLPMSYPVFASGYTAVTVATTAGPLGAKTMSVYLSQFAVYNGPALASDLTTQLNTLASSGSNGYPSSAFQVTFSSASCRLSFALSAAMTTALGAGTCTLKYGTSTASEYIGLATDRVLTTTPTELMNVIDLAGPRYLVISTDMAASSMQASRRDAQGMVACIPVDTESSYMLSYRPSRPPKVRCSLEYLNKLRVRITDERGRPMNMQGCRWAIQFVFSFDV